MIDTDLASSKARVQALIDEAEQIALRCLDRLSGIDVLEEAYHAAVEQVHLEIGSSNNAKKTISSA